MSVATMGPYRLDQLGWLQFEQLCERVVELECGVRGVAWRGHADRLCQSYIDRRELVLGSLERRVKGPVTLASVWVRPDGRDSFAGRIGALIDQTACTDEGGSLVVFTNLERNRALSAAISGLPAQKERAAKRMTVIGPGELGRCLDARAELRSAMPSVLGLRDLGPLLDGHSLTRSSLDVEAAYELARVFVPTNIYGRACEVLALHGFVVLTGPPEMGKTAIARMIGLAQLSDGWEAHECTKPEQIWRAFDEERRQVFVADDAFGSTEYRPDAAELWARELPRLLGVLDEHHWLIWTSRPAPLRAGLARVHRERGSERFPSPGEVLVDAGDLDLAEKTLILFRHAKGRGDGAEAIRSTGECLVEHRYFTPERIRRFVGERLDALLALSEPDALLAAVESELATPTDAMRASFGALSDEHRAALIALLDTPAGLVDQRELAATIRRHRPGGISRPPDQLVDRLTDHFLRVGALGIGWVHPSWRDLVIDELRLDGEARRRFLERCGLHGAMLAISVEGGSAGERSLPLLVSDSDWDLLADTIARLLGELDDHDLGHLLRAGVSAMRAGLHGSTRRELESLVEFQLSATRRRWDREKRAVPVFLLEAWLELDSRLYEPIEPPDLAPSWVDLHPGALDSRSGRRGLARADEWLALAAVLDAHVPETLCALGFPDREERTLRSIIALTWTVDERQPDQDCRELAERVLRGIWTLAPRYAALARDGVRWQQERVEGAQRWWAPQDLPVPPSTELAPAGSGDFDRGDIGRVLADL